MDNYKEILDKLANDENTYVRLAVARQGYGLNKLVNDTDWRVRAAVADQGFGLEKLVDDEDWLVREAVARQGYRLDKLVNDEYWCVREEARMKLIEMLPKLTESMNKASKSKPEPFEFASKILNMDLETQNEIFPEAGSTKNIFKYFTFEEALERYNNWHNGSIEEEDADE